MTKNILFLTSGTTSALRANENKQKSLCRVKYLQIYCSQHMLAQSRETALGRQRSS